MPESPHISVLADEVLELLQPKSGGLYVDGTLGAGGHTRLLLEKSAPDGQVIGVDRDEIALALAKERLGPLAERVRFVHGSFENIPEHLSDLGVDKVDGILLDLGVSSMQLDTDHRGFSFTREGPVDMRMDTSSGETALELMERVSEKELATILFEYGEERFSRRIAGRIKEHLIEGSFDSTLELANLIARCIPGKLKAKSRIHPATRSFQALRIAVNRELDQLERFLEFFPDLLAPEGRCAVISFHSLEDRLVKRRIRDLAKVSNLPPDLARKAGERVHPICTPLTRKPIIAKDEETADNARSRSAKLRACVKASL